MSPPFSCAFICAGLEPGRDGVGDYSRVLARELQNLGHRICLVGFNDSFVQTVDEEKQEGVLSLRLPAGLGHPEKVQVAKTFLDKFQAEWISFQFVSYGFHSKGFVHQFQNESIELAQKRNVHVMFHELWIGAEQNAGLKARLVGILQKKLILRWIKRLKPSVIDTTNFSYAYLLRKNGIKAGDLPLFGNISIAPFSRSWIDDELNRRGISPEARKGFWFFGLFGGIPPEWKPQELLRQLLEIAPKHGKKILFASIGRNGEHGTKILAEAENEFKNKIHFISFGPQSEARVSEFLSALDFGVGTCPRNLRGKSSAVATMLEHGIPVIIDRNDVHYGAPDSAEVHPQLIFPDDHLENKLVTAKRQNPKSRRVEIAQKFSRSLEKAIA